MIDEHLLAMVKPLPKIELHRHLEGSVRLTTLADIARDHRLYVPNYHPETIRPFVQVVPNDPLTSQSFLSKFYVLRQFFISMKVVRRIVREAVEDAALDNIRYMELRFTPRALGHESNTPIGDVVPVVCEEAMQAARDYDIQVGIIVSMNRHEPVSLGEETLQAALDNRERGVVGLDLAGDESNHGAAPFYDLFMDAKRLGLGTTVHAGEWGGADSVWDAIGNLHADRIGHGVRLLEDPGMAQVIKDRNVVLEVCPTSNYYSGVVKNLETHPLIRLKEMGFITTLNTDDPAICDVTLSDEFAIAMKYMAFTLEDIKIHTIRAAQAAFLPQAERDNLVKQFHEWLAVV